MKSESRRTSNGTKPVFCVRNLDNLYFNPNSTLLRKQWAKNLKNKQKEITSNMSVNPVDYQIPEEVQTTKNNNSNSQRAHRLKSLSTSELPSGLLSPPRRRTSSVSELVKVDGQITYEQGLKSGEETISHIDLSCLNDSQMDQKQLQKNFAVKGFLSDKTESREEKNQSSKLAYNHLVNEGYVGAGRSKLGIRRDILCRSLCGQKRRIAPIIVGVFLVSLVFLILFLYSKIG